ncbi:hypothetical protein ABK040_006769 [Willaertia magna]
MKKQKDFKEFSIIGNDPYSQSSSLKSSFSSANNNRKESVINSLFQKVNASLNSDANKQNSEIKSYNEILFSKNSKNLPNNFETIASEDESDLKHLSSTYPISTNNKLTENFKSLSESDEDPLIEVDDIVSEDEELKQYQLPKSHMVVPPKIEKPIEPIKVEESFEDSSFSDFLSDKENDFEEDDVLDNTDVNDKLDESFSDFEAETEYDEGENGELFPTKEEEDNTFEEDVSETFSDFSDDYFKETMEEVDNKKEAIAVSKPKLPSKSTKEQQPQTKAKKVVEVENKTQEEQIIEKEPTAVKKTPKDFVEIIESKKSDVTTNTEITVNSASTNTTPLNCLKSVSSSVQTDLELPQLPSQFNHIPFQNPNYVYPQFPMYPNQPPFYYDRLYQSNFTNYKYSHQFNAQRRFNSNNLQRNPFPNAPHDRGKNNVLGENKESANLQLSSPVLRSFDKTMDKTDNDFLKLKLKLKCELTKNKDEAVKKYASQTEVIKEELQNIRDLLESTRNEMSNLFYNSRIPQYNCATTMHNYGTYTTLEQTKELLNNFNK